MTGERLRRGPRPRGPFEDKRSVLTTRITDDTRKRLEAAAAETGRSLSQEIELRLERSFAAEGAVSDVLAQLIGDAPTSGLLMLFARILSSATQVARANVRNFGTKDNWLDDPDTFALARAQIEGLLAAIDPLENERRREGEKPGDATLQLGLWLDARTASGDLLDPVARLLGEKLLTRLARARAHGLSVP